MAKVPEVVPSIAEIRDTVDAIETAYRVLPRSFPASKPLPD